ncbi:hypothetical protein M3Y94_00343700 [Aphelenchoides besseyi]|nr:hypothetical protein M3Y94_00343700 [Aphelenchoides besseyi]KAI6235418.1 hypothetical protein M3Y95_00049600 [Aphelenchoides besseyi]
MNVLLIVFFVNMFCLVFGVFLSWLDIRLFGSGLYLALVSTVTLVIVLAFCLVGNDEQTEPTVAKRMWSKSQQTIRRFRYSAYNARRNSIDEQVNSKKVSFGTVTATNRAIASSIRVESSAPRKPTNVRYTLPSDDDNTTSSPTPTASTSEPVATVQTDCHHCVVQFHSDNNSNILPTPNYENTVIYL